MFGRYSGIHALPRRLWMLSIGLAGLVIALAIAFVAAPDSRPSLLHESGPLEGATYVVYAMAFVVGIVALIGNTNIRRSYWVVPLVGLIGFLEETSYGFEFFTTAHPISPAKTSPTSTIS